MIDMSAFVGQKQRFTRRHLAEVPFAHGQGDLAQLLLPQAFLDVVKHEDDFVVDTLDTDKWLLATDTGPTAFAILAGGEGGRARGVTGVTADRFLSMLGPPIFKGDKTILFQCAFTVSAATELALEIGLIDAVTDGTLQCVNVDTPAFANGSDDGVLLCLDTDKTQANLVVATGDSNTPDAVVEVGTNLLPTVTVMNLITFVVNGNDIHYAYVADYKNLDTVVKGSVVGALEGATALAPYFFCGTLDTTDKNIDVDFIRTLSIR